MRKRHAHLSDEALVALVARGDEGALGELYDRVGRIAYGLAVRVLRDDRLAEDAVQEGFLAVWRSAATFRAERAKARTWILTLVHRRAVDLVRREERRRTEPLGDEMPPAPGEVAEQTDEAAWLRFERERVQTALRQLPDVQREALELAYYGGFSQSELAQRLGCATRNDQEPDVRGAREASRAPRRIVAGRVMENGIHELTAGYALDVLDADERWAYETHLASCERCREELTSFWETTEALALAASGPSPSPGLRDRILASAREERQVVVPIESRRRRRSAPVLGSRSCRRGSRRPRRGSLGDAALGRPRRCPPRLGAGTASRRRPGRSERAHGRTRGRGRAAGRGRRRAAPCSSWTGSIPHRRGRPTSCGSSRVRAPLAAGLFPGREGVDVVGLDGTVDTGAVVAVTLEEAGGVEVSENDPIVASAPA